MKNKCKVADCEDRKAFPSVLCKYHAREYQEWTRRVDLSTVRDDFAWWLKNGNAATPKKQPSVGEVVSWVIALILKHPEDEVGKPPSLCDCPPEQLLPVSVRVRGDAQFKDFVGSVVFGEDEEGPRKCQAIDGWYASEGDAINAARSAA